MPATRAAFDRATLAFLVVLIAAMAGRVALLQLNPLDLYLDEAQYWMWSRSLEWGYFTKPPMVAWAIAATTALFGDAEWAVRLASPVAHGIAALALFSLGRSMFGAWAGFWCGVGWLFMPGVWFSASIISTDALMLPLWSIALLALWRMVETRAWIWALALGLATGFGAQAKYAMLYIVPCIALAAWRLAPVRSALAGGRGWLAGAVAAAALAPNVYWNARNGFVTAQHTAANADFDLGDLFHPGELWEFVSGQAGVVGPLIFLAAFWYAWRALGRGEALSLQEKFLWAFIAPPFLFVSVLAFVSRANANWAAVVYPATMVLVTGALFSSLRGRRVLAAATAINVAIGGAVMAAPFVLDPAISNQVKGVRTTRAWQETASEIAFRAAARPGEQPFTAVMVDDRATYFELNYYWREARRAGAPLPPVRMWLLHGEARNSAEAIDPMRPEESARVLIVHLTPGYVPLVAEDFTSFRTVAPLSIPLGGGFTRDFEISIGERFAPTPRDAAFEARLRRQREAPRR